MTPEEIAHKSDLCVKCGLCLPHCPTYKVMLNEGESPRGRIALIQAVASGSLNGSFQLYTHLDRCLGCRACEVACPSMVPYGQLIDGIRNLQNRQERGIGALFKKGGLSLFSRPMLLRIGAKLLHAFPRHRLSTLAQLFKNNSIKRFIRLLPEVASPIVWQTLYPAAGISRKQAGLFLGCVSRISDQSVLQATVQILNKLGQDVIVPPGQVCCGALHLHGGEPVAAKKLAALNQVAFGTQPLETIVTVASGCGAHIKEHSQLLTPVLDVCAYLDTLAWPDNVALKPLRCRVAVHDPCSLRNILRTENAVYRLLGRIPGIELIPLPGNELCCGAGGINLLTQPQIADALLDLKLSSLQNCQPDILLTSNTSCSLHLAAGIRAAGLDIELLHPVELLNRQLVLQQL